MAKYAQFTIQSVVDFLEKLQEYSNISDWGYRGHGNDTWRLESTLLRAMKKQKGFHDLESFKKSKALWNLEKRILEKFRAYAIPHINSLPQNDLAWLALGQHHGLPTRLIDWTENPLVALFFALNQSSQTNSVVWAISTPQVIRENEYSLNVLDKHLLQQIKAENLLEKLPDSNLNCRICRYHPSHLTPRITAQQGFFYYTEVLGIKCW